MSRFLGIDTSCYTTSVAIVNNGEVELDKRIMLNVPKGTCGLRQSDGVFEHVRNLEKILSEISLDGKIDAVGVSAYPRNVEGSYMPVFLPGVTVATAIATSQGVPLYKFSHQQGHIKAAAYSADFELTDEPFLAFHLSGGTSELLLIDGDKIEIVGGSKDIPAGQLIDRVGVHLGLDFPCGRHLEALAEKGSGAVKVKICVDDTYINFSGIETKLIKQTDAPAEEIAFAALDAMARSVEKVIHNAKAKFGIERVLMMGGVSSNKQLRQKLDGKAYFGSGDLSRDNSVGIALLAQSKHEV